MQFLMRKKILIRIESIEFDQKNFDKLSRTAIFIPEVSWVGLLLEGMEGFPSPFESLRTILWY